MAGSGFDDPGAAASRAAGLTRRTLIGGTAAGAAALACPRHVFSQAERNHPLAGKSVH
ncbi:MAG: twin-arginine translocation signal domain-containing protein, partial [Acetobacteraceae bacterium]|nr:twin-arginine translocation signal domain-containing protein [Acetobacteraceae bacterium]